MKRYKFGITDQYYENPTGEWCKYTDVEDVVAELYNCNVTLLQEQRELKAALATAIPASEFDAIADKIALEVSERAKQLEADIKVLAEKVLAAHKFQDGYYLKQTVCTCQACEVARRYVNES